MCWGVKCNGHVLYIPHITTTAQQCHIEPLTFQAQHTIPHLTSHHISQFNTTRSHITWRYVDIVVWNLAWCGKFCNARCRMLSLIHPNVAVMWKCEVKYVRCYMWCHAMSEVLWNVVMRCGITVWYMWNMTVCCDARCEMWLRNTEWCGM